MVHKVDVKSSRFMKLAEPNFDGCSRTKSWNRSNGCDADQRWVRVGLKTKTVGSACKVSLARSKRSRQRLSREERLSLRLTSLSSIRL